MKTLPDDVKPYSKTPVFNAGTTPVALQKEHRTKPGVWGRINILEGRLGCVIPSQGVSVELTKEKPGIVEPDIAHQVQLLGPVSFFVEFYR